MNNPDRIVGNRADLNLDEIAARFRPVVGFKVRRSLGWQNPDWEDVTNEILAQVVAKVRAGEFRGESGIGTFIYTIACRRVIDYIREKTKPSPRLPEENPAPDAQSRLEEAERNAVLAEAVRKLPLKYRQVLDFYYYREMSREETARRIGITPAKVSERVHYAQKLLRKNLSRGGIPFFPRTRD